jgi:hypothetical protein
MLQGGRSRVQDLIMSINSIYVILLAALNLGVHSASNRQEYQKQKNNVSGSKARPVHRADNLAAFCELIV